MRAYRVKGLGFRVYPADFLRSKPHSLRQARMQDTFQGAGSGLRCRSALLRWRLSSLITKRVVLGQVLLRAYTMPQDSMSMAAQVSTSVCRFRTCMSP